MLSVGAVFVSLFLAELAVRVLTAGPQFPGSTVGSPYPCDASDLIPFTLPRRVTFTHQADAVTTEYRFNSFGFRGEEISQAAASGPSLILALGDSFTLGWGVAEEDCFVQKAENQINTQATSGKHRLTHWINAGYAAGYTIDHYLAFLRQKNLPWPAAQATALVVTLYTGNDLEDIRENRWVRVDRFGLPLRIETRRAYVDYQGHWLDQRRYDQPTGTVLDQLRLWTLVQRTCRGEPWQFEKCSPRESASRMTRSIVAIQNWADQRGVSVCWVLIPPAIETEKSRRCFAVCRKVMAEWPTTWIDIQHYLPPEVASDHATALQGERSKYYIPGDDHFTPLGHQLVADKLCQWWQGMHRTAEQDAEPSSSETEMPAPPVQATLSADRLVR